MHLSSESEIVFFEGRYTKPSLVNFEAIRLLILMLLTLGLIFIPKKKGPAQMHFLGLYKDESKNLNYKYI